MKTCLVYTLLFLTTLTFAQDRLPFQSSDILPPQLRDASYQVICDYLDTYFEEETLEYDADGKIIDNDFLKYHRWKNEWYGRLTNGDFPGLEYEDQLIELKIKLNKTKPLKKFDEDWKARGPFKRSGLYWGMGRVMAIDFHPTDENTYWVGAAKGGIWKTEDGGQTYTSLGDKLPYHSVTNLVVDKEDPDHIIITLGDRTGWWQPSIGIYQTFDGGENWEPTNFTFDMSNEWTIFDMQASPANTKKILVASADGLYKSEDGNTFNKVVSPDLPGTEYSALYPRQIAFHPTDPEIAYVAWFSYWDAQSGIYKTEDGGDTWSNITQFNTATRTYLTLATTPVQPDKLVAKFDRGGKRFVRVSQDRGLTWNIQPEHNEMDGNLLYLSPTIENKMYSGYFYIWGSGDDGKIFRKISAWDINNVHVDQWYIRHNPLNGLMYWCNDGGVYSYDEQSDRWTELNNTLAITQMYDMSVSQNVPEFMIMGSQDNGGAFYSYFEDEWLNTNGGDGMTNAMNPQDFRNFYSSYVLGQAIYRTRNSWLTVEEIQGTMPDGYVGDADWLSPFCLNPTNPDDLFAVSSNIYHSKNQGDSWERLADDILFSAKGRKIEVSPADGQTVVTIGSTLFAISDDYGITWSENQIPGNRNNITNFELDALNADRMWMTAGGFDPDGKIFVTSDKGKTWDNITANLPNVPALSVIYDNVENRVYLGTEIGVFTSDADIIEWEYMDNELPFTQINDFELQIDTRKLFVATYGRGVYEYQLGTGSVSTKGKISELDIELSPNPASDNIFLSSKGNKEFQVSIFDIKGRLLFDTTIRGAKHIDISHLENGVYSVIIESNTALVKTEKLVISK